MKAEGTMPKCEGKDVPHMHMAKFLQYGEWKIEVERKEIPPDGGREMEGREAGDTNE